MNSLFRLNNSLLSLRWLLNTIAKNYQTLNNRVQNDPIQRNEIPIRPNAASPTPSKTESINSDPFKPIHTLLQPKVPHVRLDTPKA